jgi:3-hydroxyphenylacetate 6-hydroxylase
LPKATYSEAHWGQATIPPNTLVFLNTWACNRGTYFLLPQTERSKEEENTRDIKLTEGIDPDLFTEPDSFAPERWLPDSRDYAAHQFAFGLGGRMCVASLLAHNALYTVYLHLIARYQIFPASGKTAEEVDPIKGLKGLAFVGTPRGYQARFVPRDGQKLGTWLNKPDGE